MDKEVNKDFEDWDYLTEGLDKNQIDQNSQAMEKIARATELNALSNSAQVVELDPVEMDQLKGLPDPGDGYYSITVKPKFLTNASEKEKRDYIFKRFLVIMVTQGIADMANLTPSPWARILVTGKSNPKFKDSSVVVFSLPDRPYTEVKLKDLSPLKRIDANYCINAIDPEFEYFTLEEAADDIRVGYKPPKASDDSRGSHIQMIGPENINEIGEVIGEPQRIVPYKPINIRSLEAGDLVIVAFGGNVAQDTLGSIGYGAVIDDRLAKGNSYVNHFMLKVKVRREYDPYYILFALGEEYVRQQLRRLAKPTGANQMLLTRDAVTELKIRKLDDMAEIGRKYQAALNERRHAYETIAKLRG